MVLIIRMERNFNEGGGSLIPLFDGWFRRPTTTIFQRIHLLVASTSLMNTTILISTRIFLIENLLSAPNMNL